MSIFIIRDSLNTSTDLTEPLDAAADACGVTWILRDADSFGCRLCTEITAPLVNEYVGCTGLVREVP